MSEEGARRVSILADQTIIAGDVTSGIFCQVVSGLVDVYGSWECRRTASGSGPLEVGVGAAEGSGNRVLWDGSRSDTQGIEWIEGELTQTGTRRSGKLTWVGDADS